MGGAQEQHAGSSQVDRALLLRLRIYLAIFVVAGVLTVIHVLRAGTGAVVAAVLGGLGGLVLGVVASRVSRLSWDSRSSKVVGRIDAVGLVVLVGYVLLVVFKKRLLAHWFAPSLVAVTSIAVLTGLMLGQAIGTAGGIARVLHLAVGKPRGGRR